MARDAHFAIVYFYPLSERPEMVAAIPPVPLRIRLRASRAKVASAAAVRTKVHLCHSPNLRRQFS